LHGTDIGQFSGQKFAQEFVVVETRLDGKTFNHPADPVLVEFVVRRVLPEGVHALSRGSFLAHLEASEDRSVDTAT